MRVSSTLVSIFVLTLGAATVAATAAPAPKPSATPLFAGQPTPYPMVTLGPASQPTALAFPAYGSPAPGVGKGPPPTNAPQIITLTQAINVAFALSPALVSARADEGIAHAALRLQQTGYYPNLSISGSTTHSNRQPGGTPQGVGSPSPQQNFSTSGVSNSLTAQLRQLIFDGGKVAASIRSASYSETAFVDTYKADLETVAFNVAQAYYNALLAQRTTAVAVEIVRLDLVQEDLVRANIRAGVEAPADLSTAQLPTAQARVALVKAQAAELSAQATLANALGLDANVDIEPFDDTPVTATGAISTLPVPTYDQAMVRAIDLRPDYDAQLRTVQASEESLRAARAGYFPTLSGTASAGPASTSANGGDYRNSNSIGLSISIPVWDQGITQASVLSAKYNLDKANAQLVVLHEAIQLDVKKALVNLVAARAQLDQVQAEYAKANDVLRATQAEYRAGVTTLPLLLNAQVGITQALSDQVSAVYALRQAEQAYLFAVGANTP